MGSSRTTVPTRIAWAVDLLDVKPDDQILEIGCGPGVAVSLLGDRLGQRGRITAIDRSATAIERTLARSAEHVAAGRAVLYRVDLAHFDGGTDTFDKVLAVNVNVFWTTAADPECAVLRRVLRRHGVARLVYGDAPLGQMRDVAPTVAATLNRHGFATDVIGRPDESMTCITGHFDVGG